jgi:hypothetical protein
MEYSLPGVSFSGIYENVRVYNPKLFLCSPNFSGEVKEHMTQHLEGKCYACCRPSDEGHTTRWNCTLGYFRQKLNFGVLMLLINKFV